MSLGFDIPPEQAPKDPSALGEMLNFLNEVNTGYALSRTWQVWEDNQFPDAVMSRLVSMAQTTSDYIKENGPSAVIDLTELYKETNPEDLLQRNPECTERMVEVFNDNFWNDHPERFVTIKKLGKKTVTILGGIPPINIE